MKANLYFWNPNWLIKKITYINVSKIKKPLISVVFLAKTNLMNSSRMD